ncbi:hypothetical protein [uncultured Campylobacter sp.]|uniref:hypothetical protein n=1 Tax=uncultured Campylobacter sp. TaxID=218934 RepID=UPI003211AADA
MTEYDAKIKEYRKKISELQQKKKEILVKKNSKFAELLYNLMQDENFYSDFLKLLEKYKAKEILETLEKTQIGDKNV